MLTRIVAAGLLLASCATATGPVTGVTSKPRFFVEALSFRAHNETGIDATGSDEVVAVFDMSGYRLITTKYGDVDSGETRSFISGQNCILPATDPGGFDYSWTCVETGAQSPLTFTVALYEHDGGILSPLSFCVSPGPTTSDILAPSATPCIIEPRVAALIGRMRVQFSEPQLIALMPRPGDTHTGSVSLFGGCDGTTLPCVAGGTFGPSPDYSLTYRITRVGSEVTEPPVAPNL